MHLRSIVIILCQDDLGTAASLAETNPFEPVKVQINVRTAWSADLLIRTSDGTSPPLHDNFVYDLFECLCFWTQTCSARGKKSSQIQIIRKMTITSQSNHLKFLSAVKTLFLDQQLHEILQSQINIFTALSQIKAQLISW